MFRRHRIAWHFHQNTMRWPHNTLVPGAEAAVPAAPYKEYLSAPLIALPTPQLPVTSLADAIAGRASCRRFTDAPVTREQISTVLYAAYGVLGRYRYETQEFPERPVPSGGGLYPLELYLLARSIQGLDSGLYHYTPVSHALEQLAGSLPPTFFTADLFLGQDYAADAGLVIVFTGRTERTMKKYEDRGYRYLLLEAGHAAQNVNLVTAALGLGAVNLGGFFDAFVAALLQLDLDVEVPLYAIALGCPDRTFDRVGLRPPREPRL